MLLREKEYARNIAINLTILMNDAEIDDNLLSEWCELHPRTIANYRQGAIQKPALSILHSFAEVFRTTIEWIITDHEGE